MTSVFGLGSDVEELKSSLVVTMKTYCFDDECWQTAIHWLDSLDSSFVRQQHPMRQPINAPILDTTLLHVRIDRRSSFNLFNKDCNHH